MNGHQNIIQTLEGLIDQKQDSEAYKEFNKYFNQNSLISPNGDDSELSDICNPIGLIKLHFQKEWKREVAWWNAVIETIKNYEKLHNVNLHKGLPYHNKALPFLELNDPKKALESLLSAYSEDIDNFGTQEAERRPAYKIICFLLPMVEIGLWSGSSLAEPEKDFLIRCFIYLFQASLPDPIVTNSLNYLQKLPDSEMSGVLTERYKSIKDDVEHRKYPVNPISLSGSIIEGVLEVLLIQDPQAQSTYNLLYPKKQNAKLKSWTFNEKIGVSSRIGILHKKHNAGVAILCHLLRDSRNLIHPSRLDKIGKGKIAQPLKASLHIASMLKTALDIVLNILDQRGNLFTVNFYSTPYQGLGSPSQPGYFDEQGVFHPFTPTQTSTSTSKSSSATMGSSSTTTT